MNSQGTLRRLERADIPAIARLHAACWSDLDLSVRLGERYLRLFYETIVAAPDAFTYVFESSGRIIAYASGFENYPGFNRRLGRSWWRLGWIVVTRFVTGHLTVNDLRALVGDERKLRRIGVPNVHWGSTAVDPEFRGTPVGRHALVTVVDAVFRDLAAAGHPGCWGACDTRNIPMIKWLEKLGFVCVDTLDYRGKQVVVYEKSFATASKL